MKTLAIIPARAGSKRLPGKNREKVGGVELWRRAMQCVPRMNCAGFLATDDEAILSEATADPQPLGGLVRLKEELTRDETPMRDVVLAVFYEFVLRTGIRPQFLALLQPTSPLRTTEDVRACLDIAERTGCDSVVSVTAKPGHIYERNGAVYVFRYPRCEVGGWTQFYVMPPERSIDIDTAEELAEARRLCGS